MDRIFSFESITRYEGLVLTIPFSEVEIKQAVWDYGSFKSPGPDGINLDFIKYFCDDLKDELMHFFDEFHRNRKLIKGINSTCIILIPKVESPQRLSGF